MLLQGRQMLQRFLTEDLPPAACAHTENADGHLVSVHTHHTSALPVMQLHLTFDCSASRCGPVQRDHGYSKHTLGSSARALAGSFSAALKYSS